MHESCLLCSIPKLRHLNRHPAQLTARLPLLPIDDPQFNKPPLHRNHPLDNVFFQQTKSARRDHLAAMKHAPYPGSDAPAAIFLNPQFIKAMRNQDGTMQANAHLKGMFLRLCKLLSMKVKPVLVFDGKMPALKRKTNEARRKGARKSQGQVTKLAEQLLRNKIKAHALQQILEQQRGQGRQQEGGGGSGSRSSFDFTNPNAAGRATEAGGGSPSVSSESGGGGGGGGGGMEGGGAGGTSSVPGNTGQLPGHAGEEGEWEYVTETSSDDDEFSMIRGMGSKAGPRRRKKVWRRKAGEVGAAAAPPLAGARAAAAAAEGGNEASGSGGATRGGRVRPVSSSDSGSDDEEGVDSLLGERVAVALPPGEGFRVWRFGDPVPRGVFRPCPASM